MTFKAKMLVGKVVARVADPEKALAIKRKVERSNPALKAEVVETVDEETGEPVLAVIITEARRMEEERRERTAKARARERAFRMARRRKPPERRSRKRAWDVEAEALVPA